MKKPMEWWLCGDQPPMEEKPSEDFMLEYHVDHVIEYSAYSDLARQLADAHDRLKHIELANSEMTKNDHYTFGKMIERIGHLEAKLDKARELLGNK